MNLLSTNISGTALILKLFFQPDSFTLKEIAAYINDVPFNNLLNELSIKFPSNHFCGANLGRIYL